jgi:hypothetical protein
MRSEKGGLPSPDAFEELTSEPWTREDWLNFEKLARKADAKCLVTMVSHLTEMLYRRTVRR